MYGAADRRAGPAEGHHRRAARRAPAARRRHAQPLALGEPGDDDDKYGETRSTRLLPREPGASHGRPLSSSPMPRTIASIVDGRPREDAPGGRLTSTNPARTDEVVAEVLLGDAQTFEDACRAAREAQHEWAAGARAGPRPRDRQRRPARRAEQGGALAPRHPGGRQALRRVARRGAGDHRHLRLLRRRGPAALRPDRAVGDARQAAVHVPRPGRRRRDHHRRQLPGRGAVVVPRPGDPVRQRGRLEAGRVLARARRRARAAVPRRRRARRRAQPRAGRGRGDVRGPRARARRGPRRQGRLHRLERRRRQDRRAVRAPPAEPVPRARRQEPARGDGRRRPRPRRRGRAVLRLRHRRPALHVARRGGRPRGRARRVRQAARRAHPRGRDRRPDRGRPLRPDAARALRRALRGLARPDRGPPRGAGLERDRPRSAPTRRATASSATPRAGSSTTRRSSPA